MTYTYRLEKGSALSNAELDENFQTVDQQHASAVLAQENATQSANAAAASASFRGTWAGKTGAATMPASYSHLGKFWALAVNIPASPGIQSKTPGTAAEFVEIPISGLTAAQMHAATAKATPADADELPLIDSAASWGLKTLTWGALKTAVKAWLVAQANTWTAKQSFAGFTNLGESSPAIKIKTLSGTLPATAGSQSGIAHGVDSAKIISVAGWAQGPFGRRVVSGFIGSIGGAVNNYWSVSFDGLNLIVETHPSMSANILSAAIELSIIYKE